jgi:hypothetical protein
MGDVAGECEYEMKDHIKRLRTMRCRFVGLLKKMRHMGSEYSTLGVLPVLRWHARYF